MDTEALKLINMTSHRLFLLINGFTQEQLEELGRPALEFISDYPIYGSMSNLSYEEAIGICLGMGGEIKIDDNKLAWRNL